MVRWNLFAGTFVLNHLIELEPFQVVNLGAWYELQQSSGNFMPVLISKKGTLSFSNDVKMYTWYHDGCIGYHACTVTEQME